MSKSIDLRRHRAALPVFTPSAVAPESLARRTVGREAEIDRLVRAIRTAATTDNRPHQLIVGPRGSGKSHLLIVALHEALADEQIADRVAVAMLPEDAVEIAGYEDLLVSIVDRAFGDDDRRDEARDLRSRHDVAGLERVVLEQLDDRVLILVIENLDRVFRDLGERGQARLRNLTETSAKVLLLASTPLLFDAVSDHARPWYGSFDVEHLQELDAEQGRELLKRVAVAADDDELAASLATPTGLARVRAVEHLAGGSPRMWTVLAGCLTVELLDELVPLVEALFDELAPYYQQRLWELAGVERKLVYELCRVRTANVKELAHSTGLSQRAAATSLGRLHEAGWVRREKRAGADQRATWYSLREPLLRHHVEYRETRGDQLPAIVGFLRDWYETSELVTRLAEVDPDSLAEAYVRTALSGNEWPEGEGAWPPDTLDTLVAAARCWLTSSRGDGLASRTVGVVCEAVGVAAREGATVGLSVATARLLHDDDSHAGDLMSVVSQAVAAAQESAVFEGGACARGLFVAAEANRGIEDRDRIALGLLSRSVGQGYVQGVESSYPEWLESLEAAVDGLAPEEHRLRRIYMAWTAQAPPNWSRKSALADITELLLECAAVSGPRDLTMRVLAIRSLRMSGSSTDDEHRRFASTVANVCAEADVGDSLIEILMVMFMVRSLTDASSARGWLAMWADATRGFGALGVIHRFMTEVLMGDIGEAYAIIEKLENASPEHLLMVKAACQAAIALLDRAALE